MLRTQAYTGSDLFESLESAWKNLAIASSSASPFQTWEWHSTWMRHFGRGKSPRVLTVHEGEDLVGLMPLISSGGAWRVLRPMGIGPADYLHPLIRDGYEESVNAVLSQELRSSKEVDLLDLHQMRETRWSADAGISGLVLDQATCLVLDLPGTYDAYLGALGKSLRYDVRKLDKSLFSEGRAQIEQVTPNDIGRGMDVLFEQHKKRWRKRGLPGAFIGKATRFHNDWAKQAATQDWLWLSVLKLDGEAIGAIYAMAMGSTCYYYQAGFDPERGSVSPGTLLVAQTIRRSIEEGKRHFDFMRGDEPYKRRWKPQHVLRNLRIVTPLTQLGKVGMSWNLLGSRVEDRVRARLEGRGLL